MVGCAGKRGAPAASSRQWRCSRNSVSSACNTSDAHGHGRHVKNLNDENLARRITKKGALANELLRFIRSIPATFRAPCSSVTTFPVTLRPVHHERLHPAHIARCDSFFLKRPGGHRTRQASDRLSFSVTEVSFNASCAFHFASS